MSYKTTRKVLKKAGMYTGELKETTYELNKVDTKEAFNDLENFVSSITPKVQFKKQIARFKSVCALIQNKDISHIKQDKDELIETAKELQKSIKTLLNAKKEFEQSEGGKKVELEYLLNLAFECMAMFTLCLNRIGFEKAVGEGNNQIKGRKEKARNTEKLNKAIKKRAAEISKTKPHLSKKSIALCVSNDRSFWDDLWKEGFAQANKTLSPETIRKKI
ncbi:MAG: hypothetical protein IPO55_07680 [Alphaproteobacteria bacterium]|nr:hypothetical protein [Alphaproteobacteria bacterium]